MLTSLVLFVPATNSISWSPVVLLPTAGSSETQAVPQNTSIPTRGLKCWRKWGSVVAESFGFSTVAATLWFGFGKAFWLWQWAVLAGCGLWMAAGVCSCRCEMRPSTEQMPRGEPWAVSWLWVGTELRLGAQLGAGRVIPASIPCLLPPKWEPLPRETGKLPQHQLGTASTGGRKKCYQSVSLGKAKIRELLIF